MKKNEKKKCEIEEKSVKYTQMDQHETNALLVNQHRRTTMPHQTVCFYCLFLFFQKKKIN